MAAKESRSAIADAVRLYDDDFYEWCMSTARLLRAGHMEEVDLEHVAEEIEDLGKSLYRELDSRTTVLILHLLKMRFQPGEHTRSWDRTVIDPRIELRELLRHAPSLRRFLGGAPGRVYKTAVDKTVNETGLAREAFPSSCPFTPQEIFGDDLIPAK